MSEQKRYYWIKLKTDFFNQETVDLLLSQPNGCQYVVLYQMLCLITANNNGEMASRVGEMIVPYNVEKIVRDTKYFDYDTVAVALDLFKKLGLIYLEEDGVLKISGIENMVGSETKWAERKRLYREQKALEVGQNEDKKRTLSDKRKRIDIEIDIEKDIEKEYREKSKKKKVVSASRFAPPSLAEVKAYCYERSNTVDPEQFVDFYTSKGWKVGSQPMKDWKAAVRTWEKREERVKTTKKPSDEDRFYKNDEEDDDDWLTEVYREGGSNELR